jgi:hypothetical protein
MARSAKAARRFHATHDRLRREVDARRYSLPKAGDTLADAIAVLFIMLGGAVLIAFASTIGG